MVIKKIAKRAIDPNRKQAVREQKEQYLEIRQIGPIGKTYALRLGKKRIQNHHLKHYTAGNQTQ